MTINTIKISDETKGLIAKLPAYVPERFHTPESATINLNDLLPWLQQLKKPEDVDAKDKLNLEALYAAVLKDIHQQLLIRNSKNTEAEEKKQAGQWGKIAKFSALVSVAFLYFGSVGFGEILSITDLFVSLPGLVVLLSALAFSVLSIIVFCIFDLADIAESLGLESKLASQLIDEYLNQMQSMKGIREQIEKQSRGDKSKANLEEYIAFLKSLQERQKALQAAGQRLKEGLNRPLLRVAKLLTIGVVGILVLTSGFFGGQSVAVFLGSFIVASAVAPTFWPIILVSAIVAVAALVFYLCCQRQMIEKFVSRWVFGLDNDKVERLSDMDELDGEAREFDRVIEVLEQEQIALAEQEAAQAKMEALESKIRLLEGKLVAVESEQIPMMQSSSDITPVGLEAFSYKETHSTFFDRIAPASAMGELKIDSAASGKYCPPVDTTSRELIIN